MKAVIAIAFIISFFGVFSQELEMVKKNVVTILEDIYEDVWLSDLQIQDSVIAVKFLKACNIIDSYKQPRVPPSILPENVNTNILEINQKYDRFTFLLKVDKHKANASDWQAFTMSVKGNGSSPFENTFKDLVDSVYNHEDTGIFRYYILRNSPQSYEMSQSEQQALYNLYTMTQISELKAYTVLQVVFNLLDPNREKIEDLREHFYFAMKKLPPVLKKSIERASQYYWENRPSTWTSGVTYDQLYENDRVSLMPVHSDIKNNKVIVGLRLIRVARTLYIQPKQGTLLPEGKVNPVSVEWVPLKLLTDNAKEHVDYHRLVVNYSSLDLDTWVASDQLVTGVSFSHLNGSVGLHLHVRKYSFLEGKIQNNTKLSKQAKQSVQTQRPKVFLKYNVTGVPWNENMTTIRNMVDIKFLKQNTVKLGPLRPYIDIRSTSTNPPVPLSGVGIHFKGSLYSGGVIGLNLVTINLAKHVNLQTLPFKKIPNLGLATSQEKVM